MSVPGGKVDTCYGFFRSKIRFMKTGIRVYASGWTGDMMFTCTNRLVVEKHKRSVVEVRPGSNLPEKPP